MTEDTKFLFLAPWFIFANNDEKCYDVYNSINDRIASNFEDIEDAKRYIHLPELYDALNEAVNETCSQCNLGMNNCKSCIVKNWLKLLKKVKEGK